MIYVLTGANWFGIKSRLDGLRSDFIKKYGDLSVESLDGEEVSFERLEGALDALPLLAEQKMLVVDRLAKNKSVSGKIDELAKKSNKAVTMVLVEPEIDKRGAYYKALKKLEGFEEYNELEEREAANWLVKQAHKKDASLSVADANYIVSLAGNSQRKLASELEKLIAYSPEINRESIGLLVEAAPQSSIFTLLDAVFRGDLKTTLKLYADQRAQGVEPMNIVGMMAWQLHAVALVQASKNETTAQIGQQSGLKPFVLQKSQQIAARLDRRQLQKLIDDLLDLDIKFKTTPINQDTALKNLFAQFS